MVPIPSAYSAQTDKVTTVAVLKLNPIVFSKLLQSICNGIKE